MNIDWQKRAEAAESRLATVFERTRERCACFVENSCTPESYGADVAKIIATRLRALQPEGEESAAAQESNVQMGSPKSHIAPAPAADRIVHCGSDSNREHCAACGQRLVSGLVFAQWPGFSHAGETFASPVIGPTTASTSKQELRKAERRVQPCETPNSRRFAERRKE